MNNSIEINGEGKKIDVIYNTINRFTRFIVLFFALFYSEYYFLTNYETNDDNVLLMVFYLTVVFMIIFFIIESMFPVCSISIIEHNLKK